MEFRILHLSDVHAGTGAPSLVDRFIAARELAHAIPGDHEGRFDAVVISGDLTRGASSGEFAAAAEFVRELIARDLKHPDPWRVIVVPGNHDVDWAWCTEKAERLAPEQVPAKELETFLRQPQDAALRVRYDRQRLRLEPVRFDPASYHARLANFQAFVDAIHGGAAGAGPQRRLGCTADPRDHWAAHVFPEEGLAFYGFSSCHGNDSHWTGAAIHHGAIAEAALHAKQHAAGLTRIAVWHHGLTSGREASDFLPIGDVGELKGAGFHLGLHGHTHVDEFRHMNDTFSSAFPILAVGSFGAGDGELPRGIPNQFAVVSIFSRREVVQRIFEHQQLWRAGQIRRFDLRAAPPPDPRRMSIVGRHRRVITIDRQGIARHEATYEHLTLDGKLRVAAPVALRGRQLDPDPAPDDPRLRLLPPAGTDPGFYLVADPPVSGVKVSWGYRISNAYAAFPGDTRFREAAEMERMRLGTDEDGVAYRPRALTGEVELEIRFDDPAAAERVSEWRLRVEHQEAETWAADAVELAEAAQLTARGVRTRHGFSVTVPNPLVGHRYTLLYRLPEPPDPQLDEALAAAGELAAACRARVPATASSATLGDRLDRVVRATLATRGHRAPPVRRGGVLPMVGSLWDRGRRGLVTVFGQFPNSTWGVCFAHGEGIVGHSFRTRAAVCYPGIDPLIFAPAGALRGAASHAWIVCVPLLVRPDGPAVGTVSFADYGLGAQLCPAARAIGALATGAAPRRDPVLAALSTALSTRFWAVAADVLRREGRPDAAKVAQALAAAWRGRAPAPRPRGPPRRRRPRAE